MMVLRAGDMASTRPPTYATDLRERESARRALQAPLQRSAASYTVARGKGRTIIAGFPWFTDWGRDTFIAMRGLLLANASLQAAQDILVSWASVVSEGMLPNRFPDAGDVPEYNSVDASLWYIITVHEFLTCAGKSGHVVAQVVDTALRSACDTILVGYSAGTRFGIKADIDGLLSAGVSGVQMTWMDAITDGRVVTPRIGKPVEIQALWINALEIGGAHWAEGAARARATFAARFVNPEGGLFDVVDVDHVSGTSDASVRPNQIFAVGGLPFPVLEGAQARGVVDLVEALLLTPLGLRTLSPDDSAYCGRYAGGPAARDGAYHQGTAWPWLLGPFVDAWLAVRGRSTDAKSEAARRFLPPLEAHLDQAGLGHISEVVDGDAPHQPGGCPFQAWSLGEFIRIRKMLL
jgi:predicted glycogen debranching enzyme